MKELDEIKKQAMTDNEELSIARKRVVTESKKLKRHTDEIEALRRENDEIHAQFWQADSNQTTLLQPERIGEIKAREVCFAKVTNKQSTPLYPGLDTAPPVTPHTREHLFTDYGSKQAPDQVRHTVYALDNLLHRTSPKNPNILDMAVRTMGGKDKMRDCLGNQNTRNSPPPLNTNWAALFEEVYIVDLITLPSSKQLTHNADKTNYCRYYRNYGHTIEGCQTLRDKIEKLILEGHLRKFMKREADPDYPTQRHELTPQQK
ncbi:hypothetical protein CR513_61698, partial [Mucuna pruriens]